MWSNCINIHKLSDLDFYFLVYSGNYICFVSPPQSINPWEAKKIFIKTHLNYYQFYIYEVGNHFNLLNTAPNHEGLWNEQDRVPALNSLIIISLEKMIFESLCKSWGPIHPQINLINSQYAPAQLCHRVTSFQRLSLPGCWVTWVAGGFVSRRHESIKRCKRFPPN